MVLDFLLRVLFITDSVSLLVVGLFMFYIPVSVLKDCIFLGNLSFLLGCLFYWHIIIYSNLL